MSVVVHGDTTVEPNETVLLNLSGATGGVTISDAQGQGTITNDDAGPPSVTISDVSVTEGNAGTTMATFTVHRSGGLGAFSVGYATGDGTAEAGSDYRRPRGPSLLRRGDTDKTITVQVNGDDRQPTRPSS